MHTLESAGPELGKKRTKEVLPRRFLGPQYAEIRDSEPRRRADADCGRAVSLRSRARTRRRGESAFCSFAKPAVRLDHRSIIVGRVVRPDPRASGGNLPYLRGLMEAAIGFEPMHGGFADLSLNHLGTPPRRIS